MLILLDGVSLQDRDLLTRMTQYFAQIDQRVKEGQGWLVFNAGRARAGRIVNFALARLAERRPFISYYYVPWRDFALNAYMTRVELAGGGAPEVVGDLRAASEYDIAGRVSRDQYYQMRFSDVLLLSGLSPSHRHEVDHLASVMDERLTARRPTLLLTPHGPAELPTAFGPHAGGPQTWKRLYDGMYGSSLIAL